MMQDWADRLDLFEQNQVQVASMHLTIHLQGLPTIAGQQTTLLPTPRPARTHPAGGAHRAGHADGCTGDATPVGVAMPEYAQPKLSDLQRERLKLLEIFEGPDNLVVADYAKLAGKSRRITYEIQAGNLLSIQLGNKGQRCRWQLDPLSANWSRPSSGRRPVAWIPGTSITPCCDRMTPWATSRPSRR